MRDLIFGIHALSAALKRGGVVKELLLIDQGRSNPRLDKLLSRAGGANIRVTRLPRRELDSLVDGERHQGVVARLDAQSGSGVGALTVDLETLLDELDHPALLLILDGVTDPHNLGACLRSADAAGVDAVIVPKDRAVGLTPVVCKVACGAVETIPFFSVTNLARTLRMLKERGIWLAGAAGEAEQSLYEANLSGPLAVIMGSEEKGLRRLTREECDFLLNIPMGGSVESLNVSVATGVVLFEARRQRIVTLTSR